ncbi:MAG: Glu/Leu/Phe/Val dehydrogenase dimerization domain-containing protein [Bacteroidia bacterium]
MTENPILERLQAFENQAPEIVFEWNDAPTGARGWAVLNSLRGGAAGGGTRMRRGLDRREVESLAKTMEIKFTVSGPAIGGAKSGIDFDPADPRKDQVLKRWYKALDPLLKNFYGTGGDLNVDEIHEVIPYTLANDLQHPQQGVVQGHYGRHLREKRLAQLREGVSLPVTDPWYTPAHNSLPGAGLDPLPTMTIADLITGWGVAESVLAYYAAQAGTPQPSGGSWVLEGHPSFQNRLVLIQGWGNVAATAAYYLCYAGMKIQGILDREYGWVAGTDSPLDLESCRRLLLMRRGNALNPDSIACLPHQEAAPLFWSQSADVFVPAAASRLVTGVQINSLIDKGLNLVSCGANVPFADPEIFMGPIARSVDERIAVIPDFVANCGMARVFAYLMQDEPGMQAGDIFDDVARTIRQAVLGCLPQDRTLMTGLCWEGYRKALDQLQPLSSNPS